jgi:hypothetical protein
MAFPLSNQSGQVVRCKISEYSCGNLSHSSNYPMLFLQKIKKTINAIHFNRYWAACFSKDKGEQIYMTERKT